jgi:hypothetical protein
MHQIVAIDLNNRHFPSTNYKEGEAQSTKGCQTYGEAASTVSINRTLVNYLSSSSKVLPILFGSHIWTMIT